MRHCVKEANLRHLKNSLLDWGPTNNIEFRNIRVIYGATASGKTTTCLNKSVKLINRGYKVIYISTGYLKLGHALNYHADVENFTLININSLDGLQHILQKILYGCNKRTILILDDISTLRSSQFSCNDMQHLINLLEFISFNNIKTYLTVSTRR